MSKLDREIKAILEEAFSNGEQLLKDFIPTMFEDDLDEDDVMQKLLELIVKSKPKTYDDYIRDFKRVFKEDGWIPPN